MIRARALFLVAVAVTSCGHATQEPIVTSTPAAITTTTTPPPPPALPPPPPITPAEFAPIADLVNADIADHRLPGAVVLIGHDGQVIYRQAFGVRKLPGEPEHCGPARRRTGGTRVPRQFGRGTSCHLRHLGQRALGQRCARVEAKLPIPPLRRPPS